MNTEKDWQPWTEDKIAAFNDVEQAWKHYTGLALEAFNCPDGPKRKAADEAENAYRAARVRAGM